MCESGGGQVGQIICSRLLVRAGREGALPRNPLGDPCHLRQEVEESGDSCRPRRSSLWGGNSSG